MSKIAEINFYHLTVTPLIKAIPKILEKIISNSQRGVILFNDAIQMNEMNSYLWSFSTINFIPHGSKNDPFPDQQPIYLTDKLENPNNSQILILTDKWDENTLSGFEKYLYFFDSNIPDQIEFARSKWKNCQSSYFNKSYWKQLEDGSWEKS